MNPTGNIPIIEMPDGKILTQSCTILRHWGRLLHAAEHKTRTENEKYWADAICDIVIDCENLLLLKIGMAADDLKRANTLYFCVLLR
jgi:glutathione S-transferase